MRKINQILLDSVAPLDMAMAMARSEIQDRQMDPFNIPGYSAVTNLSVDVEVYQCNIGGAFHHTKVDT